MPSIKFFSIIIIFSFFTANAVAGTMLLLGAGIGGSGGPPPTCSNSLDFSDSCNSQYLPTIGF